MQLTKIGKFITDSSQGFCHIPCSGAGSEKTPSPNCYINLQGEHKQLVSWLKQISYMFAKQFYWHKLSRAFVQTQAFMGFSAFPLFPFEHLLIGWLQAARWGQGIPPFQEKTKPRSGPPASPGSPTFPPVFVSMEGPIMGLVYHLWGQSNIEI